MAKKNLNRRRVFHPQAILWSTQKSDPNSLDCMLECGLSKSLSSTMCSLCVFNYVYSLCVELNRALATAISKQTKNKTKTLTKNTHLLQILFQIRKLHHILRPSLEKHLPSLVVANERGH